MSLLGDKIRSRKDMAIRNHAPDIINEFMRQAENCGELETTIQEWKAYFHAGDDAQLWESLCVLTETLTKDQLEQEVGIIVKFIGSVDAEVTWSGV